MLSKGSLKIPVSGVYQISFRFGEAPDWYLKIFGEPHNGLDFAVPNGTPVLATDKGTIGYADTIPDIDGCGVIISHEWGQSLYWHLSEVYATLGAFVQKGDLIGLSGSTGYVTGPHLHFGIKLPGQPEGSIRGWVNPEPYLESETTTPEPPALVEKYHIVGFGDSLWAIAEKYYGNGLLWPRIYKANKEKIKNPNLIYPLQKFLIP